MNHNNVVYIKYPLTSVQVQASADRSRSAAAVPSQARGAPRGPRLTRGAHGGPAPQWRNLLPIEKIKMIQASDLLAGIQRGTS